MIINALFILLILEKRQYICWPAYSLNLYSTTDSAKNRKIRLLEYRGFARSVIRCNSVRISCSKDNYTIQKFTIYGRRFAGAKFKTKKEKKNY